jgi:hypothetical protein
MTQFQKIAIGLLGLTHPEMLVSRARSNWKSDTKSEPADKPHSTQSLRPPEKPRVSAMQAVRFVLAALAVGSQAVPLADNSQLTRELGVRADLIYGPSED